MFSKYFIILLFPVFIFSLLGKAVADDDKLQKSLENEPIRDESLLTPIVPSVPSEEGAADPKIQQQIDPDSVTLQGEKVEKTYLFQHMENPLLNETLGLFDQAQSWLGGHVDDLGEEVDAFFGTEEDFEQTKGTRLDLLAPIRFHANGDIDADFKYRAKIELPKTNHRWNLIVTSVDENLNGFAGEEGRSAGGAAPAGTAARGTTSNSNGTAVGLRFMLDAKDYTTALFDFGLNFSGVDPDPFVRLKGTYKWQLTDKSYLRMVQDLFWERFKGIGLNSEVKLDYQINDLYLLRSRTDGTWWDDDQYYELHHNFIYYQRFNRHRALAYHVGWDWDTKGNGFNITSYHTGFNWRERIYKQWLFFEIEPRVDFRQDNSFRTADPSIIFMLEAQFYRERLL